MALFDSSKYEFKCIVLYTWGQTVAQSTGHPGLSAAIGGMGLFLCQLPWWLSGKESASQAGDLGSIPGLGRAPGEGNGNPLHYSCLGNLMDRRAWQTTVHGVTKS